MGAVESSILAWQVVVTLQDILSQPVLTECLTLEQFQERVLVPLQTRIVGTITQPATEELQQIIQAERQTNADWWRAFWSLMGLGALAVGGAAYIDWKQSHGGYGGPKGVRHTTYTYRYTA